MDSRLMNVIYDDPFDGNYTKYDNDTEFWCNGSDTMGMQLTETLNGILPIAPTEDFNKDDSITATSLSLQNNKNSYNYEDFAEEHLAAGGAIGIVTVDSNANGYDTDSEEEEESDDDDGGGGGGGGAGDLINFEGQSQCSNLTFRTRTDSSSIGDYESHTSDYDDDDDIEDDDDFTCNGNFGKSLNSLSNNIVHTNEPLSSIQSALTAADDLMLDAPYDKIRSLSANTINSDVDGLGLNIDANNFDLAEFITKDDFTLSPITEHPTPISNGIANVTATNIPTNNSVLQVVSSKLSDSDSDSDVIVDVETVEVDDEDNGNSLRKASDILKPEIHNNPEEDISYVDDISSDPSWCPNQTSKKIENPKTEEKAAAQKQNFSKNYALIPNKKQCDILKGKSGKGNKARPTVQKPTKNTKTKQNESLSQNKEIKSTIDNNERKTGIGMGGKNLALLKQARVSISEPSTDESNTPIKGNTKPDQQTSPSTETTIHSNALETPAQKVSVEQAVKRKLNLEEYKKRRGDAPTCITQSKNATNLVSYKIPKVENKSVLPVNSVKPNNTAAVNVKHSVEVTSIVKTLKEQQQKPTVVDPITEAKNKVLRMQELKKAQQIRIIDSTISAKVPRVTKLLPLREIVKDTPYSVDEGQSANSTLSLKSHPDYEEIIIVSASCNTDISLPPVPNSNTVNMATRSLLKSTALLSTISNSFQKVKATENVKISTNSLIASIQDVVVKKSLPPTIEDSCSKSPLANQSKAEHHGEDKIIMHLRKDRIRKRTCTIGTQTDLQPEFPLLPLPKTAILHKSRDRVRRKHRKNRVYRKHKEQSSLSSSSSEYSSDAQSVHSNSSSLTRSRDNSCSSSVERIRTYDSAIGTGGYSSRSSRKHRSSISSSHSESIDRVARGRRQRRTSMKHRSSHKRSRSPYSSSSYTSDSDRSRSPFYRRSRSRSNSRTSRSRRSSYRQKNNYLDRNVSQPAVEERRIVYVGRIEQETTKDILRRKFLPYGTIKQISIHYKDTGLKYGFVTFERSQDAFAAIDNSTRDPQLNMYDVSFGGRRAFCRASYADLDNAGINTYQSFVFPQKAQKPKEEDSFEALLMKMKAKLNATKKPNSSISPSSNSTTATDSAVTNSKI